MSSLLSHYVDTIHLFNFDQIIAAGLVAAAPICPSSLHSVASAASLPSLNEETSHVLRIRTFNTFRARHYVPPADGDEARFDGPPSIGHIRDPRFPSPHIVPVPGPPRPRLTPTSRAPSLDSTYQGRRVGVDHSSSGHSNSTISNLDLDSYLFANSPEERRPNEWVHSSMERVTEGVAMWESEEV